MATLDDILGNGGSSTTTTTPPNGTQTLQGQQGNGGDAHQATPAVVTAPVQDAGQPKTPSVEQAISSTEQKSPTEAKSYTNEEMYNMLAPNKPKTEDELKEEEKKHRRKQIINAIGDGLSALSNLYFTSQYAPNMYSGENNLTGRSQVMYDRLKKEREANNTAYFNGWLRARQADERKAEAERAWQRQLDIDDYNRKRNDAKDKRDQKLFELEVQLQGHKITAAEYDAKVKEAKAKYADELEQAILETEEAKRQSYIASAGANNARAGYYNSGGGRGNTQGEYPWYDSDGNKYFARSYEAMRQNAIDNGTWNEETQVSTTEKKNSRGRIAETSETKRPGKGHSAKPQKSGKKSPTA